ncbi:MAG: DUF5672 family protein [Saprospiraceae bacterium]
MHSNTLFQEYYARCRYDLLPYPVNDLSDRVAVIVESRDEPLLRWTICNIMHFTQWPVIVYHSRLSDKYLDGLPLKKKIEIPDDFGLRDYNQLIASIHFWNSLPAHVLIFQTDSFMLRSGITPFMKYDYVGAPWSKLNIDIFSIPLNIGNGGFSLRKRNKMIQILGKIPYNSDLAEDVYFANAFYELGGVLPAFDKHKKFSVEQVYYEKPLAVHAPWNALQDEVIKKILNK